MQSLAPMVLDFALLLGTRTREVDLMENFNQVQFQQKLLHRKDLQKAYELQVGKIL
jgi:hypothetical protein